MSKCLCVWWATLMFLEQSFFTVCSLLFKAVVLNPVNPILPFSEKYFIKPLYYPEIRFIDKETYLYPLKNNILTIIYNKITCILICKCLDYIRRHNAVDR